MGKIRANKGEGSVFFRDGKWRGYFTTKDGTRQYVPPKTNKKDFIALKKKMQQADEYNALVKKSPVTFKEFSKRYISHKETRWKKTTYVNNIRIFERRLYPAFGSKKLQSINTAQLNTFFDGLQKEKKAGQTQKNIWNLLNNLFKFAISEDVIANNPLDKAEKIKSTQSPRKTKALPKDVIEQLLSTAKEYYEESRMNKHLNGLIYPFILLALNGGERRGKLMGLYWEDMDFSTNTIHIRKTLTEVDGLAIDTPKTEKSKRDIPMPPNVMKELERVLAPYNNGVCPFVFHTKNNKPMAPSNMYRTFKSILVKAGLPKTWTIHEMRHTYGSTLINANVPIPTVSENLGHSNISTTLNVYTHAQEEGAQKAVSALESQYDELNKEETSDIIE